jgi:hypothetical protein
MLSLSGKWAPILNSQSETGMSYQAASVSLKDGRRFDKVVVIGGYIASIGGNKDIPFTEAETETILVNHGK